MVKGSGQRIELDGIPPIKVVGVGGAGCKTINRLIQVGVKGVEFIAINTDAQDLMHCQASTKIRIGDRITRGLGAGGDPEKGRQAAEESLEEVKEALKGADMVFITAGMGGGTGTGAAPLIAQVARNIGALTVAVVTRPFSFEMPKRRRNAEEGLASLEQEVDTLITISNDRLLSVCPSGTTVQEAFLVADDVLRQGIQGIVELITVPGDINLDFADVRRIMSQAGPALMAIGHGKGDNRAVEAAKAAIHSPLLDTSIQGARGVLYNVVSDGSLTIEELNMAGQVIAEVVDHDAEVIFGTATDPNLGEEVKIILIAVGFPSAQREREAQPFSRVTDDHQGEPFDADLPSFLRRPRHLR